MISGTELTSLPIAREMELDLARRAAELASGDVRIVPQLAIVSDNPNHPPTKKYVELKQRVGAKVGITTTASMLVHDGIDQVIDEVNKYNSLANVDGIIVQLPLYVPTHENTERVVSAIDSDKDVDGLGPNAKYVSATSSAIMRILDDYDVAYRKQEVAIFGRGRLVGKPLLELLQKSGAQQVDTYDLATPEDERLTVLNRAPIIITAMGVTEAITPDLFDDITVPRVLIDAGTAEQAGELYGDVSDELREVAHANGWSITPKKGGVGMLTVRTLLSHVVDAAEKRAERS